MDDTDADLKYMAEKIPNLRIFEDEDGKITRDAKLRVVRDGIIVAEDAIQSLRRFKDDVKEVASGYECGIGLEKFNDLKEGDIFEAYITEEYRD